MESESLTNHTAILVRSIRTVHHTERVVRIGSTGHCTDQLSGVLVVFPSSGWNDECHAYCRSRPYHNLQYIFIDGRFCTRLLLLFDIGFSIIIITNAARKRGWFSWSAWSGNVGWDACKIMSVIEVIQSVIHLPTFPVIRCNFALWKENKKQ